MPRGPRIKIPTPEAAEAAIQSEATRTAQRASKPMADCSRASRRLRDVVAGMDAKLAALEGSNAELRAWIAALDARVRGA